MTRELQTAPLFEALRQPLALVESEERRKAIEAYLEAARIPLERAVHDLMSELTAAVHEQVGQHYTVRLAYQGGALALEVEPKAVAAGDDQQAFSTSDGDVEKITIRIPAELKDLAQQAASQAGTSANTWFVKALARAVRNIDVTAAPSSAPPRGEWREEKQRGRGARLSGWVGGDEE